MIFNDIDYLNWIYKTENVEYNDDIEYDERFSEEEAHNRIRLGELFDELLRNDDFPVEYVKEEVEYADEEGIEEEYEDEDEDELFESYAIYFSIKDKYFKLISTRGFGRNESLELLTEQGDKEKCRAIL